MSVTQFKTCMSERVVDTLLKISEIKTPVVRSCHIGNNTSNNWGWLALSKNTQLVQYDHTSYGVDENCAPWLVLEDNGIISSCYDHNGNLLVEEKGRHINLHLKKSNNRKYSQHLNYGLYAEYNGKDLIKHHYDLANKISVSINNHTVSFDTKEIISIADKIKNIIFDFARTNNLDLLFSRWIKRSKKGYVMMHRIGKIIYGANGNIEIYTNEASRVFTGTLNKLCDLFFSGVESVQCRISTGKKLEIIDYPWVTLNFSYLIAAIKEYELDSNQKNFWHAGGSASQYYINDTSFISTNNILFNILIKNNYLPHGANITLIPSFGCQLFATNMQSLEILESLLEVWKKYIRQNRNLVQSIVNSFSTATHPKPIVEFFFKEINLNVIEELKFLLEKFNKADINRLPVAHIAFYPHPSYNKYGVAQYNLLNKKIHFPKNFYNFNWGEIELFLKILAEIVIDEYY